LPKSLIGLAATPGMSDEARGCCACCSGDAGGRGAGAGDDERSASWDARQAS
jgi:hypothetical protein